MNTAKDPGEAAVPAGFRLGDGWTTPAPNHWSCTSRFHAHEYAKFAHLNRPGHDADGGPGACSECAVVMGALVPIEPPVAEPPVDWSRFVPTEEIPEDMERAAYLALVLGDIFASWDLVHGGTTNRYIGIDRAEKLAGAEMACWWQRRVRLIRHADGRWADGYGPDGPIPAAPAAEPATSKDLVTTTATEDGGRTGEIPRRTLTDETGTGRTPGSAARATDCATSGASSAPGARDQRATAERPSSSPIVPVAEPGARCRVCGHYETSLARATGRYAHCPACGRAPHWIPVGDDDVRESVPPVAEPARPVCNAWCGTTDKSAPLSATWARGQGWCTCACADAGRPLNHPPVPPGPVPPEGESVLKGIASEHYGPGSPLARSSALGCAPAAACRSAGRPLNHPPVPPGPVPPEGEPVGVVERADPPVVVGVSPAASATFVTAKVPPLSERMRADLEHARSIGADALATPIANFEDIVRDVAVLESQLAAAIRDIADEKAAHDMTRDAVKCAVDSENAMRAERDEQRGRAERAERADAMGRSLVQGARESERQARAEVEQIRAKLEDAERPPAGTRCGNLDCGPNCTHGMSLVCGHDDEDSECNNQRCAQADAIKAAVASERERLLNTPEFRNFADAVVLEAQHQRERWGTEHDAGKTDADWFWLIGYLAGKALFNPGDEADKQLHRIITVAAAAANWHAQKLGQSNMRPGIDPPSDATAPEMVTVAFGDGKTADVSADVSAGKVRSGADAPGAGKP